MITVYGLTDEHGQIRYVGSTKNPSLRFNQHRSGKCGVLFNVHGLAVLARANTGDLAVQHERSWVDYFGMDNLFNKARPCSSSGAALNLPALLSLPNRDCSLTGCSVRFAPRTDAQRFCCAAHKNLWHQRERYRIVKMVRQLGVGK